MSTTLQDVPVGVSNDSADAEFANISAKLGLPLEEKPVEVVEPNAAEKIIADAAAHDAKEPAEPAAPKPKSPDANLARMREMLKEKETEIARLKAEREGLSKTSTEAQELKARLAELEAVKAETELRLKKTEDWWKNEGSKINIDPDELPEVVSARDAAIQAGSALIPSNLAGPGEHVRRISKNLPQPVMSAVVEQATAWETAESNANLTPKQRDDIQLVALSNMAKALGVDDHHFEDYTIGDQKFKVIDSTHPVYHHLVSHIEKFVGTRAAYLSSRQSATENLTSRASEIIRERVKGNLTEYQNAGIGVVGDALASRLKERPDDKTAQAMKILEQHTDLLTDLQTSIDDEARANGHSRVLIEIPEPDPEKHTALARAYQKRLIEQKRNAPLVGPLKELVLRQHQEIETMRKELADFRKAKEEAELRGETGPGSGGDSASGGDVADVDPAYAKLMAKLGVA